VQRAGVVAIERGEATVARTLSRYRAARDYLVGALTELPGIEIASPPGAMYAFFRLCGLGDSLSFCKQLVRDGKVGLAPGSAFGAEGEGLVRWCFASDTSRLADGVARFSRFLASRDSK
jgi:aspartate/methionine/tyrosine aminotransferase